MLPVITGQATAATAIATIFVGIFIGVCGLCIGATAAPQATVFNELIGLCVALLCAAVGTAVLSPIGDILATIYGIDIGYAALSAQHIVIVKFVEREGEDIICAVLSATMIFFEKEKGYCDSGLRPHTKFLKKKKKEILLDMVQQYH